VGVDASVKHDSAAVVAVYYDRELKKVTLARHRVWQPSSAEPLDLDGTIGQFLRDLQRIYSLGKVRYDPYQMHELSTRLQDEGLPMEEYPQTVANLTDMGQNLYELVKSSNLQLYPDEPMRTSAGHAVAMQSSRGWRIAKEKAAHKIDVIVALAMASIVAIEQSESWYFNTGEDLEGDDDE
jgi:phage terminase large subunit-like protein